MRRKLLAGALVAACMPLSGTIDADGRAASGPLPLEADLLARLDVGDLVFREGTEFVSAIVRATDGVAGGWSHVGLLVGTPGDWRIVHAVPSEQAGRADGVVLDRLDFFLDRQRARSAGFYRVQADRLQRQAAGAFALRQLGKAFRLQRADGGTYCTELVHDAYATAGVDLGIAATHLQLPMLAGDYLLPNALSMSHRLRLMK